MKNLLTVLLLLTFLSGFSQTSIQLSIEKDKDSGPYKLKLEKTVNGETVTTEKTYSNIEEIKNDPELRDVDIHFLENGETSFSFTDDKDKNVLIELTKDIEQGDHNIVFVTDGDEGEDVNMKVWTDEDGKTHVMKNGEEMNFEGKYEKGENVFVFKSTDDAHSGAEEKTMEVKVWIDENGEHHAMVNGEEVDYDEWKKDHKDDVHFNFTTTEDGDGKTVKTEVIVKEVSDEAKDGKVKVFVTKSSDWVIHVEDITSEDAKTFALDDNKELKLDEFNFYPNPSNGAFRLQFNGKDKPTMVKVTDINGKEIYNEEVRDFGGSYDKEIDLSGNPKGIYLLQVVQGGKAVNKKIVIE